MSIFQIGWYLIYTRSRHEKKVWSRLADKQIECLLPMRKTFKKLHDRCKYVDEPLFPSYIFVRLEDIKSYYGGMDTEGVLSYVKCGKHAVRVNDSVINNIRLIADKVEDVEVSRDYFQPGHRLVISHGALTGVDGEVVTYKNKQQLLIRVQLLQRSLIVTLPEEAVLSREESSCYSCVTNDRL
ncbi:transcriptional antiterminator RfaH [Chitinophaga sp. W3I9]|uniref:UpxY family transcription antiterminator n=1 Tax=unclassified Chitinophaga TaxID=2619133 RepID=UPI003D1B505D